MFCANFGSGVDFSTEEFVVPLHAILLMGIVPYKQAFTSQGTVLLEGAEAHLLKAELAVRSEKEAVKKKVLREVSKKGGLKTHLSQWVSATCVASKKSCKMCSCRFLGIRK